jgi:hypothetical protein
MTLEQGYYWSQIVLTGIVAFAAIGAYVQLQTYKRSELLKILEDSRVRKARRLLYLRLRVPKEPPQLWWENDDELEEVATTVCASYDIVGLIAKGRNRRFFVRQWSYNICWTYEVLNEYLSVRHPVAYHGYRKFYGHSKPFDPRHSRSN